MASPPIAFHDMVQEYARTAGPGRLSNYEILPCPEPMGTQLRAHGGLLLRLHDSRKDVVFVLRVAKSHKVLHPRQRCPNWKRHAVGPDSVTALKAHPHVYALEFASRLHQYVELRQALSELSAREKMCLATSLLRDVQLLHAQNVYLGMVVAENLFYDTNAKTLKFLNWTYARRYKWLGSPRRGYKSCVVPWLRGRDPLHRLVSDPSLGEFARLPVTSLLGRHCDQWGTYLVCTHLMGRRNAGFETAFARQAQAAAAQAETARVSRGAS